jgi:hypothetical protein
VSNRAFLALTYILLNFAIIQASVIHVPADQPTIQQGIDISISGDTVLVADGVYSGNGNHDITFGGKAIVVKSANGPEYTVIDCQGDQWNPRKGFLFINEGRSTVLDGFTITNGSTGPYCLQYSGGAIYCEGSPTIKNCRLVANTNFQNNCLYSGGGAMFCFLGSPLIIDCVFESNDSDDFGGAVNSTNAMPVFVDCEFHNNSSPLGSAVYSGKSYIRLYNCLVAGNHGDAGTIESAGISRIEATTCTIVNNISAIGGVIRLPYSDTLTMVNCILRDPSSPEIAADTGASVSVSCSDISGGWPGVGNIDCDPLFCDPGDGDFTLSAVSCCVGAGSNGADIGRFGVGCGALGGIVTDVDGFPIRDVIVSLIGSPYQAATDSSGQYLISTIAPGIYDVFYSHSQYDDTLVNDLPIQLEYVTMNLPLSNSAPCESYVVGDINGSGGYNGLDVTFGVSYLKGGMPPPYECECGQGGSWHVAGDVNASCSYNGLDITYGVNYFKGEGAPAPCPDCAP